MKTQIESIMIGKVEAFGPKGEPSAFRKRAVSGLLEIGELGIGGDEQADRENHGGRDKAILHYAYDHYAQWRMEKPELAEALSLPGAFGENISSCGFTEQKLCIGDQIGLGTAVVQISQGRQPCWKLGHRFGDPKMVKAVIETKRCGWYYRVLQPGTVSEGDDIELMDRPHPEWSVAKAIDLLHDPKPEREALEALTELPSLSSSWKSFAQRRLDRLRK